MKRESEVLVVLGKRGSGKSYWTKRHVEKLTGTVLIWDPTAEWAGPHKADGLSGANVYHSTREAAVALAKVPNLPRVVLQCPLHAEEDFALLCRLAGASGDCTLVVDEAHSWCAQGKCPRYLLDLLRLSRHKRVNLVFIAQRPHTLAVDLREQASRVVLFHMSGQGALDWVRGELHPDLPERVLALKPREWIEFPSMRTSPKATAVTTSATPAKRARKRA